MFNEFSSEVDLNSPDGMLRSKDVDSYIENALKPLFEEGKAFKQVRVNRRTGARTTRYAFQGGKKIQDSVKAVLDNMHAALGYDVDPATGNVMGTNAPPPMSITNLGRHNYNETRERILDPRTAAAIKAQAQRVGGSSTTNKATGITTTLVRAGLSGETRAMRQLVDDTDQKYLEGQLPSSALADGASPASVQERARAKVNRREAIRDAERQARADYIRLNPASQLAVDEAIRMQHVTDRATRQRLLRAERTPGTQEFQGAVDRRLHKRSATNKAMLQWAKKNKKDPVAKQILKGAKGGSLLSKMKSAVWFTAIIETVKKVYSTLAKVAGVVFNVGTDLHDMKMRNAVYNITSGDAKEMVLQAEFMRLPDSVFSNSLGVLSSMLSGPRAAEGLNRILTITAPMSANQGNKTIDESVALFLHDHRDNPVLLLKAILSEAFANIVEGADELGMDVGEYAASRSLIEKMSEISPSIAAILNTMIEGYRAAPELKNAVAGAVKNGNWYDAVREIIFHAGRSEALAKLAPQSTRNVADSVHELMNNIIVSLNGMWDALLVNLLASLKPLTLFVEGLLRWVVGLPGVRSIPGIATFAHKWDEENKTLNDSLRAENDSAIKAQEIALELMSSRLGVDPKKLPDMIRDFTDIGKLPDQFKAKGEQGLKEFLGLLVLKGSLEHNKDLDTAFNDAYERYYEGKGMSLIAGSTLDEKAVFATGLVHKATKQYYHNVLKPANKLFTQEDYDKEIKRIKEKHVNNARVTVLLPVQDTMSFEQVWNAISDPSSEWYAPYNKTVREGGDKELVDQLKDVKAMLDGISGPTMRAERFVEDLMDDVGSPFDLLNRVYSDMANQNALGLLGSAEATWIFNALKGNQDFTLTIIDNAGVIGPRGKPYKFTGQNRSQVTVQTTSRGGPSFSASSEAPGKPEL